MIIEYLTDHSAANSAGIAVYVSLKPSRVRDYHIQNNYSSMYDLECDAF